MFKMTFVIGLGEAGRAHLIAKVPVVACVDAECARTDSIDLSRAYVRNLSPCILRSVHLRIRAIRL